MASQFIGPGIGGGGGGSGAPTDATYVVGAANASLANEIILGSEAIATGVYGGQLVAALSGRLYLPNNGIGLLRDDGVAWQESGPLFSYTAPYSKPFAWINQGSASVNNTNGGLTIVQPAIGGGGGSESFAIRKIAAPATPYTIYIGMIMNYPLEGLGGGGICFRQSSDGKLVVLRSFAASNSVVRFGCAKMNSATSFNANYFESLNVGFYLHNPHFFVLKDDGTDRWMGLSNDGINVGWCHKIGRTDFLTADEVGYFAGGSDTFPCYNTLVSWRETA